MQKDRLDTVLPSAADLAGDLAVPLYKQHEPRLFRLLMPRSSNGIGVSEGARDLLISSGKAERDGVLVAVMDSGPGLASADLERLFDAFYTTKPGGLGMGLSICRSIIEAHGGRLGVTANMPRGPFFTS